MYVHRSNRTEILVDELAALVRHPVGNGYAAECIVVQGRGMERWLSMELAQRCGIWANPDFPFPRRLIERALAAVGDPCDTAGTCFGPERLLWSVADLLPAYVHRREFASIRRYLAHDAAGRQRLQLAERIAEAFDQYVVYRPDLVLAWERGEGRHWQAVLWRALVARHGATHIAARAHAALGRGAARPRHLGDFPARVSIFGVSTLPPLYLNVLLALGDAIALHLFILSPSREYWGDIRSRRELLRQPHPPAESPARHLEEGHPLLASLGRVGREFQELLEAEADYVDDDRDLYRDPGTGTMLAAVQADMVNLRNRGARGSPIPPLDLPPHDHSIIVHSCHSAARELEVLHDQLVSLFEEDPTLEPRDVVVMCPSIDTYAPFIDAVFGRTGAQHSRIPYRIADRHRRATDVVVDAFLTLLTVLRGRMRATDVLDLLGREVVRTHFGMTADDLDVVRTWVVASGIRWGVDAEHRAEVGQPALGQNTWRFGLDRLRLGYAMPGDGRRTYGGVLPYDDIEGSTTVLLGRLLDFCEHLFTFRTALQSARPPAAWRETLGQLLDTMIACTDDTAHQHGDIRAALAQLADDACAAGFGGTVDLDSVHSQLERQLQRTASPHGFLGGGVTFCALVPMRIIPFRVICLLGMNDGAFPRVQRPLGFDLIAQRRRRGDRTARDDDRYLFLEAILSARDRLVITYVGQSIRDNAEMPPSVVVNELLDVLGAAYGPPPSANGVLGAARRWIRERVVVQHPLQPFSPRYFRGKARLFSYDRSAYAGAVSLTGPRHPLPRFLSAPLPDADGPATVTVDELARFLENPSRGLLQRLGIFLDDEAEVTADREPIDVTGLAAWEIGDLLLPLMGDGEDPEVAVALLHASGKLPFGSLGHRLYQKLAPDVSAIARTALDLIGAPALDPVLVDGSIDGTRLTGVLGNLWPRGQIHYGYARRRARAELRLWIRHVVLNWAAPREAPRISILVGRPEHGEGVSCVRFRPVADPPSVLRHLLHLYRLGQTGPLPLFPRSSLAYAATLRAHGSETRALAAAQKAFAQSSHPAAPSEQQDAYVRHVFAGLDPLDPAFRVFEVDAAGRGAAGGCQSSDAMPSFAAIARTVFEPLLAHREDV